MSELTVTLQWVLSKTAQPRQNAYVVLHTPQYEDVLGAFVGGEWNGEKWVADDHRELEDIPPVHWAYLTLPSFKGDADDWAGVEGVNDGDSDNQEEEDDAD